MKRQSVAVGSGPELIGCEQLSVGTIVVDGVVRVDVVELELLEELEPRLIALVTVTVAEVLALLEGVSGASGCCSAGADDASSAERRGAPLDATSEARTPTGTTRLPLRRQVAASRRALGR